MPNEEKPQDFELIELLIKEGSSITGASVVNTPTQQSDEFRSFKARFQSYIDQIPSYLHSVGKEGFFPHFFLGSFSILPDTEIAVKLGIKKVYFRFDTPKTLKIVVVQNDQIKKDTDVIRVARKEKSIGLFSISEHGGPGHQFTSGELEYILKENLHPDIKKEERNNTAQGIKDRVKGRIKSKLVQINRSENSISVEMQDTEILDSAASHNFYEIKKEEEIWKDPEDNTKTRPEDYIAELTDPNIEEVKKSSGKVLSKISEIHSKYENSLTYADKAREAAHHGFIAGALVNFRYRHNLRVYLEQFAGRGYADIVLVPRGKDRSLNAIPIIIELKAATKNELEQIKKGDDINADSKTTPAAALKQAEDYAKGFQPNVMRVLTISDNILCVGVNLDYPSSISGIEAKLRGQTVTPLFSGMLKSIDERNKGEINEAELKEQVQDNMERIYHTFPGTGEKGDNHYFSRFLLGQSLLLNKVEDLDISFEKQAFIYGENIATEAQPEPQSQRLKDKKNQGQDAVQSSKLDQSHGVMTIVFIPTNDKISVYVMNIVETDGRTEVLKKGIPIDQLKQKVGNRKIVELDLNFNINKKSDFEKYFSMEVSEPMSLEQYNNKKTDKFKGSFENIPYPTELKETFDKTLESQRAEDQSSKLNKAFDNYKVLLEKIGKGIYPLKSLITKEAHFQAVLHGAFNHYSDIKLGEPQENRALVLTEFQTGRGKRIDMVIHGIKFENQASNAKEYDPVGLELKGPREGKTANALADKANDQISKEYEKGVTYKTLTDGTEVAFMGIVFHKGTDNANSLILPSKNVFTPVKVVHSSIMQIVQQQPRKKFDTKLCVKDGGRSKRSVNLCLFSKNAVEKFSKGNVDENNVDKVIIDSEKFLTYVKSSQDEGKNAQLIEFIGNKNIEGDYKYLVGNVIEDQGYERYIKNERIRDLYGDIAHQNSGFEKNLKLKSRLMNAAGGIQLIRGIHGTIVSCKDGTAVDCGLNLGGVGWSFASQPIENVMVKIAPKVVESAEKVVVKLIPGTLGKQTKFAVQIAGVKFGSTIAKGAAGALAGVFDIVDIGMSANNLVGCKNRENSDNPCGEKEIRDNIASISFGGVSFISGVALTAASMPVVGIGVGFGLMVGHGIYSGVSNIVEYEEKYDTTSGENWSIFWRTLLFQDMAADVQHLKARKDLVNNIAQKAWRALSNSPDSVVTYAAGFGRLDDETLFPGHAEIVMNRQDANTEGLSRVIPDRIQGASMICLPQITNDDYEKDVKSSVSSAKYYCDNAMVISHNSRINMKQKEETIVYDLENVDEGIIVGSNQWNNKFLIYSGKERIAGGDNIENRYVLVNNPSFSGEIIGGKNSTNILDLSQLKDEVIGVNVNYSLKSNASGSLKVEVNGHGLINDQINNEGIFNYHYVGRKDKVDKVLCMGYSEHFKGNEDRDIIIDSRGGSNNNERDVIEVCKKVIVSPYTTVKGGKSNYTFYVKTAGYKGKNLHSEINVDGMGSVVFPEFDLLDDCDQITYSRSSNTLSLKISFGQNNEFTLDIRNYVEESSNRPHFLLIDKNGSNIVPKIERSDISTIRINSFELHSEHSLDNFDDVENHYKKILNNNKNYNILGVIRDKAQSNKKVELQHVVFGSAGNDIINFDHGTMVAKGGNGSDMYVIDSNIEKREIIIDNNSDDKKLDMLVMPEVPEEFSIHQCNLHLNYNNTRIQVRNYLQGNSYRHLMVMNSKGETFIPYVQTMLCIGSPIENGKLVPFFHTTQTQNMFLLPKDFQGDHVVIDSNLEDIEKYKDEDDLLLIRERGIPFVARIEDFYNDQSKWRDVNFLLWNNGNFFPYLSLQQKVDGIMEYEDKLKNDYEKIIKEYVIDFTKSVSITHNQDGILTSVGQDEEHIGVMILKNIAPDQIEVSSRGLDLIFIDKKSNYTINVKNWDNSESYRIATLEFDVGLEPITIGRLDRFNLSEVGKIQDLIGKASENYQNRDKYTTKVENDLKCLISINGFKNENRDSTYQCLGFSSLQDQISFTENICILEELTEFRDKSNSTKVSVLSKNLQNKLSLNGYDQNIVDKCSKLIEAEENNQQAIDKISSMVRNIEESTSLSQSGNKLDLGRCLSKRRKRSSDFCPVVLEDIQNELNREERRNIVVEESSIRVITSGHETLVIENLPIQEVVINDNIKRKRSLRSTLDLRKLVEQIDKDLGINPISMVIKDASDLLIKLSISATNLQQDVITVRLKDALINKWYKKLQIIFNNAPMEIGNGLELKPSLLISDQRIIVVTPQDVEEKNKLVISKKAGQYSYLHDKYDLIVTNAFNANIITNNLNSSIEAGELFIIYFKDFYKEPKMKTLSIRFTDKEVLLVDEIDKIYNSESADKLNYVSSILKLQKSSLPLEGSSSNDIEVQGKFKRTPLHCASGAGDWDKVRILLDIGDNIEVQDKFGYTPIFLAIESGKWSIVKLLLDYGANINAEDIEGRTPLSFATSGNNLDLIQFLLDRGASIESQDKSGYTPILYAASSGRWSEVRLLIDNGAKTEVKDIYGWTPLHFAASSDKFDIVKFLCDKKANIKARDIYGNTPLHVAVKGNKLDTVKFLLDRGADTEVKDIDNQTPLELATQRGYTDIVKALEQERLGKKLFTAVREYDSPKVEELISQGANLDVKDRHGNTPLDIAINTRDALEEDQGSLNNELLLSQQIYIVGILEQEQLSRNLFTDVREENLPKVRELINQRAGVNAKNKDDKTPLDIAKDKGHNNIVEYLEKKLREERGKPVQRKRRYHHVDYSHHHSSRQPLAIDVSNQPEIAASSTTRPSSWIKDLFSWVKSSVGGLFHSRAVLSEETSSTTSSISQVDAPIDVNGTIMLLDVLIRKVTGQKYISSVDQATSLLEAQNYALNITNEFEKVVKQAASKSEISTHRLNINFMKIHDEITEEIIGGKFNEISGILKSHIEKIEKACPNREAGYPGKLSPKKFDKFKDELNKGMDATLKQEILHSRDSKLEVSNVKGSLKPRSDLNNTYIQGHLTQARDVRLG